MLKNGENDNNLPYNKWTKEFIKDLLNDICSIHNPINPFAWLEYQSPQVQKEFFDLLGKQSKHLMQKNIKKNPTNLQQEGINNFNKAIQRWNHLQTLKDHIH